MASITQYYGIAGDVPFVDVDTESDTRLFVDPHRIRLQAAPEPFAQSAIRAIDDFLNAITSAALSSDPVRRDAAEAALQRCHEPRETHLGMARIGFNGHGASSGIGSVIWSELNTNLRALIAVGILRRLDHLPLFVSGVDSDVTSDITTRIVYGPLADFTDAMLEQYPELTAPGHTVAEVERPVWDVDARAWQTRTVRLPAPGCSPLLLVPRGWVGHRLLMRASRYYDTTVLGHVQSERQAVTREGKVLRPPKWALKRESGLARGRPTIVKVTSRASNDEINLVDAFEAFVLAQEAPPTG